MYPCNSCIKIDVCKYKDRFLELVEEVETGGIEEPFALEVRCIKWISCDIERNAQVKRM